MLFRSDQSSAPADDWSWVDHLRNADDTTKQRLKVCVAACAANYALLRRASFDFDLQHEIATTDPAGKMTFLMQNYKGTVRWRDGSVRYDFEGDNPFVFMVPEEKGLRKFSVIRTKDMLAYTEIHPTYGAFLVVDFPPSSYTDWTYRHPNQLTFIDPWVHYASIFRGVEPSLREFWEGRKSIESEESGGVIRLQFWRGNSKGRLEIYCDAAVDYLPVKVRGGDVQDNEFVVIAESDSEWRKADGIWYPAHYVQVAYQGADRRPLKQCDLTVRNLRLGSSAEVPDSAFTLNSMAVPEKTGGIDRRTKKGLIKLAGMVRESRVGDPIPYGTAFKERMAWEMSHANQQAEAVLVRRAYWGVAFWVLSIIAGVFGLFVVRRVYVRKFARSV